jgi:hypothetical protein
LLILGTGRIAKCAFLVHSCARRNRILWRAECDDFE